MVNAFFNTYQDAPAALVRHLQGFITNLNTKELQKHWYESKAYPAEARAILEKYKNNNTQLKTLRELVVRVTLEKGKANNKVSHLFTYELEQSLNMIATSDEK